MDKIDLKFRKVSNVSYEFAKKAEEVGFSQLEYEPTEWVTPDGAVWWLFDGLYHPVNAILSSVKVLEGKVRVPTLEELIDACGDRFETVIRIVNKDLSLKHWLAHGFGVKEIPKGDIAIEAVAKLYLKLHE